MATIAKLAVMLSANAASFTTGMSSASKVAKATASTIDGAFSKVAKVGALLGAIAGAGGLALLLNKTRENIDQTAKLSDRLGVTTEALIGLQHGANLAGVDAEAFNTSLEKMVKNLGEAAITGKGPVVDALDQIGLSAQDLVSVSPDEAMKRIADGLTRITNPAQRAAIAVDLFGKTGQKMLNTLMGGRAGLEAAANDAQLLGLNISRIDAAQVERANDAFTRMQALISGAANRLVVELAPYATAAMDKMVALGTAGGGIGPKTKRGVEMVLTGIATIADYLSLAKAGFLMLQTGATASLFGIVTAVDYVGKGIENLINLLPGEKVKFTQFTEEFSNELLKTVNDTAMAADAAFVSFNKGENAAKVRAFFKGIKDDATKASQAIAAAAVNITGSIEKIIPIDELEGWEKRHEAAMKKIAADAEAVFKETRTPLENYEAEINKLGDLLDRGAIDWDTYARAVKKANVELDKAQPGAPNLEGTAAREFRFTGSVPNNAKTNTQENIEKNTKAQLEQAKMQNARLKQINDKLSDEAISYELVAIS